MNQNSGNPLERRTYVSGSLSRIRITQGKTMLVTILGVVHLILFLIAAFEILTSGKSLGSKFLWLLLIFLLPIVGLIIYYLVGRGK